LPSEPSEPSEPVVGPAGVPVPPGLLPAGRRGARALERHHRGQEVRQRGRVDQLAEAWPHSSWNRPRSADQLARGRVAVVRWNASARMTMRSSAVGTSGTASRSGAIAPALTCSRASLPRPANSGRPVTSSCSTMPALQHVGAAVDRLAARLLGRHVRELALDDALVLGDVARPGDAEVDDLDRAVPRHQHVLRGDVAVDDRQRLAELVGLLVRVVEALAELLDDVGGEPVRDAAPLLGAVLQEAQQIHPLDVLHRQEVGVADRAEVEDLDDVGVVEAERDLGLVDEHRDELPALGVGRVDLLDHQRLGQALGDGGAREEHLGHASGADLRDERVFTELLHRQRGVSLADLCPLAPVRGRTDRTATGA
jgi:hypothetical protein